MGNEISIKKSTMWKGATVVLIVVLGFFLLRGGNGSNEITGNIIGASADGIVDVKIAIKNFQYSPDTITVKKGSTVRLTIDNKDNVLHGLHLPQFGLVDSTPPLTTKTFEFIAIETSTNGQAVPTCSKEHGETLTINVV